MSGIGLVARPCHAPARTVYVLRLLPSRLMPRGTVQLDAMSSVWIVVILVVRKRPLPHIFVTGTVTRVGRASVRIVEQVAEYSEAST